MVDYETSTLLKEQLDDFSARVDELYKAWMNLEIRNDGIKMEMSQSKLLERLERNLQNNYYGRTVKQNRAIAKRILNLEKRIDQRFETEYPAETIETLKAYNSYLLSKSQLNGLRLAHKAYYLAVVDE